MRWLREKTVGVLVALVLVTGAMTMFARSAEAATITWTAVTTYTDNSTIPAADVARITYSIYYGPSATGPWTLATTTAAGATSATVPVAAPGVVRYFTGTATLDGQTSAYATPYAYTTPFKVPGAPSGFGLTP